MMKPPAPPPEGTLITESLKRKHLSVRKAAKQAGISEGWWRQVVRGYQTLSGGGYGKVKGPDETVARMALVAGVTPEQLSQAGRDTAAQELELLLAQAPADEPDQVTPEDPEALRERMIRAALEGLTPDEVSKVLRRVEEKVQSSSPQQQRPPQAG